MYLLSYPFMITFSIHSFYFKKKAFTVEQTQAGSLGRGEEVVLS